MAALLEEARASLVSIEEALERIERGEYGVCQSCGAPIAAARLEALPATSTCLDCAR